jgi:hypothetical protein
MPGEKKPIPIEETRNQDNDNNDIEETEENWFN